LWTAWSVQRCASAGVGRLHRRYPRTPTSALPPPRA
jgi:hypothetical protein